MPIEVYTPRWHDAVVGLADEVFGAGYFARPSEIAREPGSLILVSQEKDEVLLGFVQGQLLPRKALRDHLERRLLEFPPDIAAADEQGALGVIQAIAVAPEQRRRGVGTTLLRVLHDRLVGIGADKLVITFKRGPSAAPVDGMMRKLGFEPWTRLPSYFRERCDAGDFGCLDRRDGCTCEALLYRKAVY